MFTTAYVQFPDVTVEEPTTSDEEMEQIAQAHQRAVSAVKKATGFDGDDIRFLSGDSDVRSWQQATAVIPHMTGECYVLFKEAYLLTETGKTIERIA